MGYTHYWYRKASLPRLAWLKAVADCRKVCAALPIPLGDGCGEGEPEFSTQVVAFNGRVDSGAMMPQVARVDGLLWPTRKAEGVAGWSDAEPPNAGTWFAGPEVSARTLPDNGDGSYESFIVERVLNDRPRGDWDKPKGGRFFECCKTNFRPYDLCVQCCLIALSEHLGEKAFLVRSDGDSEAWNEARDICQHVLGYGLMFTLDD